MASDNVTNGNVPCCEKCKNIPRCPNCGSVSLFVHPTKVRAIAGVGPIESQVTCADCGSFRVLNKI